MPWALMATAWPGPEPRARPDISSPNPVTTFHVEAASHPGTQRWRQRGWSETGCPEMRIPGQPSRQERGHRRADGASPAWRAWPAPGRPHRSGPGPLWDERKCRRFECTVCEERPWERHSLWNGAACGEGSEPGRRVLRKTAGRPSVDRGPRATSLAFRLLKYLRR